MTATRDSLVPSARRDSAIEPPYTFNQMDEKAVQREVLAIYQRARPETKILYNLGRDIYMGQEENWIIRWLLWHVFRYRDDRNSALRRTTRSENSGIESSMRQTAAISPEEATPTEQTTTNRFSQQLTEGSGSNSASPVAPWYDPVRGVYRT